MELTKQDIQRLDKLNRINLINSVTGIKPANLIGTLSRSGIPNLAIFSSVVHIGSNPALIGFFLRPKNEVARHTWENIEETGCYTINHVHREFAENAHFTSAKFDSGVSEFEQCHLTEQYIDKFEAPFVEESDIKIGLQFKVAIPIELNDTTLVIGEVQRLIVPDQALDDGWQCDLASVEGMGISGLNGYYGLTKVANYPYARPGELPDFEFKPTKRSNVNSIDVSNNR